MINYNAPTLLIINFTDILTVNDVSVIINENWSYRAKWRFIGLELGIDVGTLDAIGKSNHDDVNECFTRMMSDWLKEAYPTRSALDRALQSPTVTGQCSKIWEGYNFICIVTW